MNRVIVSVFFYLLSLNGFGDSRNGLSPYSRIAPSMVHEVIKKRNGKPAKRKSGRLYKLEVYAKPLRLGETFWVATRSIFNGETPALRRIEIFDPNGVLIGSKKVNSSEVDVVITKGQPGKFIIHAIDRFGNLHIGSVILK